jgi:hypothetical protein
MAQPGSIHRYRWKLWYYLIRLPVILANVLLLGFLVCAILVFTGAFVGSLIQTRSLAALLFVPVLLFLAVFTIMRLPVLTVHIGGLVASYVVVSPAALEVRLWPSCHVRLRWEDVARAGRYPGWGRAYDVLSLEGAEELPEGSIAIGLRRLLRFVRTGPRSLPLKNFQGYPRGGFADDLRRYAPHLFPAE